MLNASTVGLDGVYSFAGIKPASISASSAAPPSAAASLFDDGSPAAGWTLSGIKPKSQDAPGDAANAMMNQP